jgi:transcriptional regulator with XRE-family HTH domain
MNNTKVATQSDAQISVSDAIATFLTEEAVSKDEHSNLNAKVSTASSALLEYAIKVGNALLKVPSAQGKRSDLASIEAKYGAKFSRQDVAEALGLTKGQWDKYLKVARNPDAVEKAKKWAAQENGIVTVNKVLSFIPKDSNESTATNSKRMKWLDYTDGSNVQETIATLKGKSKDKSVYICIEVTSDDAQSVIEKLIADGKSPAGIGVSK